MPVEREPKEPDLLRIIYHCIRLWVDKHKTKEYLEWAIMRDEDRVAMIQWYIEKHKKELAALEGK